MFHFFVCLLYLDLRQGTHETHVISMLYVGFAQTLNYVVVPLVLFAGLLVVLRLHSPYCKAQCAS